MTARTATKIATLAFAFLTVGCVHFERAGIAYFGVSHPTVVTIHNGETFGRGVAIDRDKVLTVEHVAVGANVVVVE